jgi:hypothetical protein
MSHSTDIVAYTYNAETYCPDCIIKILPTGDGQAFDGWAVAPELNMTTEHNLIEIAWAFGINRNDESSFDSDDFPKVVFDSQVEYSENCGNCGAELIEGLSTNPDFEA